MTANQFLKEDVPFPFESKSRSKGKRPVIHERAEEPLPPVLSSSSAASSSASALGPSVASPLPPAPVEYDNLEWARHIAPSGTLPIRWKEIPQYLQKWFEPHIARIQKEEICYLSGRENTYSYVYPTFQKKPPRNFLGFQVQISVPEKKGLLRLTQVLETKVGAIVAVAGLMDDRLWSPKSSAAWLMTCIEDMTVFDRWTNHSNVTPYATGDKRIGKKAPGANHKLSAQKRTQIVEAADGTYDHDKRIEFLMDQKKVQKLRSIIRGRQKSGNTIPLPSSFSSSAVEELGADTLFSLPNDFVLTFEELKDMVQDGESIEFMQAMGAQLSQLVALGFSLEECKAVYSEEDIQNYLTYGI